MEDWLLRDSINSIPVVFYGPSPSLKWRATSGRNDIIGTLFAKQVAHPVVV